MNIIEAIQYIDNISRKLSYPLSIKEEAANILINRLSKKNSDFSKSYLFKSFIFLCYNIYKKNQKILNFSDLENISENKEFDIIDEKQLEELESIKIFVKAEKIQDFLLKNSKKFNLTEQQMQKVIDEIKNGKISKIKTSILKKIRKFFKEQKNNKNNPILKRKRNIFYEKNFITITVPLKKVVKYKNHQIKKIGFQTEIKKISKNLNNINLKIKQYLLIGKKDLNNYGTFTLKLNKKEFQKFLKNNNIILNEIV